MSRLDNFVIQSVESIEVRGGIGNTVLMKFDVPKLPQVSGYPTIEECLPSADVGASYYIPSREQPIRYVKCRYCNVIQREFHSNCPQCGAPMEAKD